MKNMVIRVVCTVALGLLAVGCGTVNGGKSPFPVTRVTMYDCGLAQWERETRVSGAQKLEIPVTRAHLDDLLASLALATDGSVKVRSVRFPSVRTMSQAEAASSLGQRMLQRRENGEGGPVTTSAFAEMLIGVPVRVQRASGGELVGTLMGVTDGDGPVKLGAVGDGKTPLAGEDQLVVMLADGGMTWVPIGNVVGLFPLSEEEAVGMQELAGSMGRSRGLDGMSVYLETTPDSSGRLAAAHIRQSPLWRISYRVTAKGEKVLVEMWALVHNDSPEDWQDVNLTLLSGLPRSYVLSLASPRYSDREVLSWDGEGTLSPQLGARTPDELVFGEEAYDGAVRGSVGYGMGGGSGAAYGSHSSKSASVTVGHATVSAGLVGEGSSSLLEVGEPAAEETAEPGGFEGDCHVHGDASGDDTAWDIGIGAVDEAGVAGAGFRRVSGYGGTPETCVRVENTSGLVLQGGTASFYVGGRFRGQELLERTQPGDVRIWCFGQDPDVSATSSYEEKSEERILEWRNKQLVVHSLKTTTRKYEIRNDAGQERVIGLTIPVPSNGRLVTPSETVAGEGKDRIFQVLVASRSVWTGDTVLELGVMAPVGYGIERWEELLKARGIAAEQKAVLAKALPLLKQESANGVRVGELTVELREWEQQIANYREDLRAVPASAGNALVGPLVRELSAAEKEANRLKDAIKALDKENVELRKKMDAILAEMPKAEIRK